MKLYKVKNEKDGILIIRLENETIQLKKGEEVEIYSDKKLPIEGIEELPFNDNIIKIKEFFYIVPKDGKGETKKLTSLYTIKTNKKEVKKQPKKIETPKVTKTEDKVEKQEDVKPEKVETPIEETKEVEKPQPKRRVRRKTTQK